jgi:hypothetical protein
VHQGPEQDFVGIDVPDTGDSLLMHQQRLKASSTLKDPTKILARHGQWITTESARQITVESACVQQREAAKPAGIPISHRRSCSLFEHDDGVCMVRKADLRRGEQEQSRHPQFGHEKPTLTVLLECDDDALPAPFDCLNCAAGIPPETR